MIENAPLRTLTHKGLTVEGYSRAAVQSYWRVPELKIGFDMGGTSTDAAPFLEAFNLKHRTKDLVAHLSQGQVRKIAVLSALLPAFASDEPVHPVDGGLDWYGGSGMAINTSV